MAMDGVSWRLPPNGMSTVDAPMVLSKRSERPLLEATLRSVSTVRRRSASVPSAPAHAGAYASALTMCTSWCLGAPLLARNSRLTSTIVSPFHVMRTRGSAVTVATGVASRFSS